jgi:flagellar biosynthetic protein FliQ
MTPETVVNIGQNALYIAALILALLLLPALAVGLLVSMFQAATQINEQTLSFIPKLLVVLGVLFVGGHWILQTLITYTVNLYHEIPGLIA